MKKSLLLLMACALLPLSRLATTAQSLPLLQISNNNGQITLSWPVTNMLWQATNFGVGCALQMTPVLSPSNMWTWIPIPPALIGNRLTVSLPVDLSTANDQMFFRLVQPMPIFQFAIFYNTDMEICPGANMIVNGKTHVNGNVWADPAGTLTFAGRMETTASNIFYTRSPNDPQSITLNPSVIYLDTNSPVLNAPPMFYFPVGTNIEVSLATILDLPPPGLDPGSILGQAYLYNKVDILISNSVSGMISAFYQDSNNVSRLTLIPYDVTNVVGPATNYFYSFVTNVSFYDYREAKIVKAVQLNVGAFNSWLSGAGSVYNTQLYYDTGHYIDSVYVYTSVPLTGSQLPAVRMANGSVLPTQGLTVTTPFPIYVLGNYNASGSSLNNGTNVVSTAPAALLGDAITVLSTTWNDSYTSSTSLSVRNAGNTTVNAATMEGIVPSVTINGTKYYSGGVENFLRLLENWSTATGLTYNGSIVVMFNSRYATNFWQTPGNYYTVPTRRWGFDLNFLDQSKLPPQTPFVITSF